MVLKDHLRLKFQGRSQAVRMPAAIAAVLPILEKSSCIIEIVLFQSRN